jgi:hypothetical protein
MKQEIENVLKLLYVPVDLRNDMNTFRDKLQSIESKIDITQQFMITLSTSFFVVFFLKFFEYMYAKTFSEETEEYIEYIEDSDTESDTCSESSGLSEIKEEEDIKDKNKYVM